MLSEEQILNIVRNITLESFENDIENISTNSQIITYPLLIARLRKYVDVLSIKSVIPLEETIDQEQYDLYNIIREILEFNYDTKFKIHLYILHAFFNKYRDDALDHKMISRYNILKFENEKHQKTFYNLTYLISIFCNKNNVNSNTINIFLSKLLNRDEVYISDRAKNNLYKFYKEM